jgi:hypothetical protein
MVRALLIAAFAFLTMTLVMNAAAQGALQCWNFSSQAEAQATYNANPWMNLDPDGNGVACDCLLTGTPC